MGCAAERSIERRTLRGAEMPAGERESSNRSRGTNMRREAVEEVRRVEDGHGHQDGNGRRGHEEYEELDRLLEEADRSLGDGDLRGTNESLKRAGVKAASMWGEVGRPTLPGHTRRLVALIGEVQQDLGRSQRNSPDALRKDIGELRSRFELEARRDDGQVSLERGR